MTCRRAFTIIELLVVIAIIALLAAVVVDVLRKKSEVNTPKTPDKFKITYSQKGLSGTGEIYRFNILKDKDTDQEYLLLVTNDGVAITPRIPAK